MLILETRFSKKVIKLNLFLDMNIQNLLFLLEFILKTQMITKNYKKLLNDASVTLAFEASAALGSGFRCGFLGMLHMDVFR